MIWHGVHCLLLSFSYFFPSVSFIENFFHITITMFFLWWHLVLLHSAFIIRDLESNVCYNNYFSLVRQDPEILHHCLQSKNRKLIKFIKNPAQHYFQENSRSGLLERERAEGASQWPAKANRSLHPNRSLPYGLLFEVWLLAHKYNMHKHKERKAGSQTPIKAFIGLHFN